jgi:hypothetical protein
LYSLFALSGRSVSEFPKWIEQFRGSARPLDDVADYLQDFFGIEIRSLEAEVQDAPAELRIAIQEVWNEIHDERRRRSKETQAETTQRLSAHDLENYLGVIEHRREERNSPFGYQSWWLTLDRDAFKVRSKLRDFMKSEPPDSPVLSPDFLANYLAFGPKRNRVSKASELALPVIVDIGVREYLPSELIELAQTIRDELRGRPERLIRREVRDRLDAAKTRLLTVGHGGIRAMQDDLTGKMRDKSNHPS